MANSLSIRDSSTWRTVQRPSIRDGGAWRDCVEVYIRDGGAWRLAYSLIGEDFTGGSGGTISDAVISPGTATATLTFQTDGTWDQVNGGTTSFDYTSNLSYFSGSDVWIKWDQNSGTTPTTSGPFNEATWYQLSSSRQLQISRGSVGVTSANVTISLAYNNSGKGLQTRTMTLTAEVTV